MPDLHTCCSPQIFQYQSRRRLRITVYTHSARSDLRDQRLRFERFAERGYFLNIVQVGRWGISEGDSIQIAEKTLLFLRERAFLLSYVHVSPGVGAPPPPVASTFSVWSHKHVKPTVVARLLRVYSELTELDRHTRRAGWACATWTPSLTPTTSQRRSGGQELAAELILEAI